jgi:L-lactate dehydrogenase (cytochrome)
MFDYVDGGSFEEATLQANRADLQKIALKQKVLRDVSALDTSVTLFGQTHALPIVLAPVGFAGMMATRAEAQAARAAEKAGDTLHAVDGWHLSHRGGASAPPARLSGSSFT